MAWTRCERPDAWQVVIDVGLLTDWFDNQILELRRRVSRSCTSNPVRDEDRRLTELERLRDEAERLERLEKGD